MIGEIRGAPDEKARSVDLGRHVGEHPLDRLKVGDLFSELAAILRVAQRFLETAARYPHTERPDPDPRPLEDLERVNEAVIDLAESILIRDLDIFEVELGGVRRTHPELPVDRSLRKTFDASFNDERGDPVLFLVRRRLGENDEDFTNRPLGDEVFGPIQDPTITVLDCSAR